MPAMTDILGPVGLTAFLFLAVVTVGSLLLIIMKMMFTAQNTRITALEKAIDACHVREAVWIDKHANLSMKYGELQGRIESMGIMNPLDLAQKIAEILKVHIG